MQGPQPERVKEATFTYDDLLRAYWMGYNSKQSDDTKDEWIAERDRELKSTVHCKHRSNQLVRHKKSGGLYRVICRGQLQASGVLKDYEEMVVYQSVESGYCWVRSVAEFDDGRFKEDKE